jgi:hypothetical protein
MENRLDFVSFSAVPGCLVKTWCIKRVSIPFFIPFFRCLLRGRIYQEEARIKRNIPKTRNRRENVNGMFQYFYGADDTSDNFRDTKILARWRNQQTGIRAFTAFQEWFMLTVRWRLARGFVSSSIFSRHIPSIVFKGATSWLDLRWERNVTRISVLRNVHSSRNPLRWSLHPKYEVSRVFFIKTNFTTSTCGGFDTISSLSLPTHISRRSGVKFNLFHCLIECLIN